MPNEKEKGTRKKATYHEEIEKWNRAAHILHERGQKAILLSTGLAEVLEHLHSSDDQLDVSGAADRLQELIKEPQCQKKDGNERPKNTRKKTKVVLKKMRLRHDCSLREEHLLAVFIGSREINTQWLTLAVGVDITGIRIVAGLWPGSSVDPCCTQKLSKDLKQRGLINHRRVLFITDGTPNLDRALKATWPKEILVAHCQYRLIQSVLAHLPERKQDEIQQELKTCFKSDFKTADTRLQKLSAELKDKYPGATAKLTYSHQQALTVNRLQLPEQLARHLKSAGAVRTAFDKGLRNSELGSSSREQLVDGLKRMFTRRFVGYRSLPQLAKRLDTLPSSEGSS